MEKNMAGRPKKEIDFDVVEKLCALMCTGEEIASFVNVNYDTLVSAIKRKYKLSFSEYYKKYSDKGKLSLRRMQYKAAESGNVSMLIWLGKQYLGQTEKQESDVKFSQGDFELNIKNSENENNQS